jgi:hypothetical protein
MIVIGTENMTVQYTLPDITPAWMCSFVIPSIHPPRYLCKIHETHP